MLKLEHADFSAIYQEPQHEFLRRGIIERQNYSDEPVASAEAAKLRRFRNRWERLSGQRFGAVRSTGEPEAFLMERLRHRIVGGFFFATENVKRLVFEFLPLTWLRTYRLFKSWLCSQDQQSSRTSIGEQIRQHDITIVTSFLLWAAIVGLDNLTGPEIILGPLYLVPCATLALVVGSRLGFRCRRA